MLCHVEMSNGGMGTSDMALMHSLIISNYSVLLYHDYVLSIVFVCSFEFSVLFIMYKAAKCTYNYVSFLKTA